VRRTLYATMAALGLVGAMLSTSAPAQAVQSTQPNLVSAKPVDWTPGVDDGAVRAIVQVGNTIVLGGTFTSVTPVGGVSTSRPYLLAFNATTGALSTTFAPTVDGPVDALVAAPDGQSVYVGGEFANVNGVKSKGLARLRLSDGGAVTGYKIVVVNGNVLDLKLSGNRLWIGGNFTKIATMSQPVLATVNATNGTFDPFMSLQITGLHNGGTTAIQKFDISPDNSKLVMIGNFTSVGGVAHNQAAMLDLTGASAALANWGTSFYNGNCASVFDSYMRDLDISPDGSYVVISTTGAYGGSTSPCDETSRWEMTPTGQTQTATWTDYTGGDTTYAVAITGTAVYVGGHFRWQNNAFAGDRASVGAVAREGIAALDPKNGMPLDWDPGRARGVGVFDMLATPTGLWVGSDTDRIGGWGIHPKIAFFPLTGGKTVPPTATPQLPALAYVAGNTNATNTNVLYRVNAAGPALPSLDSGPDWSSDSGTSSSFRNTGSSIATYASGATANPSVPATTPNAIFDSERYDPNGGSDMQWAFPATAGRHLEVRLYFANRCTCTQSVGQRKFNVSIDNVTKLSNFDIVQDTGGTNIGEMKSFLVTSDGSVNINFTHVTENPLVNGIEIIDKDVVLNGTPDDIKVRSFDGTTSGTTTTLPSTGIAWSQSRGGFYINGLVYSGWSDGNLYARPFDGTTFGAAVSVAGMDQIVPLTAFHTDIKTTNAMFFDSAQNRLYFTLAGTNALYYRAFTPSTNVIGAVRYQATNTSTMNFANASAMYLSGSTLYVGDRTTGNLVKVSFGSGVVSGTPTTVSGPGVDSTSWYARSAFLAPVPGAPNQPPTAAFTSSCTDNVCDFDASGSTDSDGIITSYTWTFGDGDTAASSEPTHTYAASGTFPVTLTVSDNGGDSSQVTHSVSVTSADLPPTAAFTSSCTALACSFDGSGSSDPDGTVEAWSWTFGDGGTASEPSPSYTYDSPGSYSVTLKVTDDMGAINTLTQQVTVSATAANIGFVAANTGVANAVKVNVTVPAAVQADNTLLLYATSANATTPMTAPAGWTLVDSATGTGVQTKIWTMSATAGSAGTTVPVSLGVAAKTTVVLAAYSGVSATTPIGAHALALETTSKAAHVTPTVSTSLTGAWLVSYWSDVTTNTTSWTPPAGQSNRATVFGAGGGHVSSLLTDLNGPLTVGTVGGYSAKATVASAKAAMATVVLTPDGASVPNNPPTAAFTSPCTALSCSFDSSGSSDSDGTIASYAWTFGDGGTSPLANPSHTYGAGGTYDVTLTVTDNGNAVGTLTKQVTVSSTPSNIGFVAANTGVANAVKVNVTVPAAVQAGNTMLLYATSANATTSLAAPAGWTLVDSAAGTGVQTKVWSMPATAGSAGSTVAVNLGVQAKVTLVLAAYSGVSATGSIGAHAVALETTSQASHVTPTLSTSLAGAWLVSYWSDVTTDTTSWTPPAGQSNRATVFGAGGGHVSSLLTDLNGPLTVGTVGGYTAKATVASAKAAMVTVVLKSS
jgi:PKD repeat protein